MYFNFLIIYSDIHRNWKFILFVLHIYRDIEGVINYRQVCTECLCYLYNAVLQLIVCHSLQYVCILFSTGWKYVLYKVLFTIPSWIFFRMLCVYLVCPVRISCNQYLQFYIFKVDSPEKEYPEDLSHFCNFIEIKFFFMKCIYL